MYPQTKTDHHKPTFHHATALGVLLILMLTLSACGGTKVYSADKTVVYRDSVYNVSNVKVFTSRVEGVISGSETMDLKNADKKKINGLLEENDEIFVRQVISMDEQEVIYQAKRIDSWSDFSKMQKQFDSANKDLTKFLGDKKDTQLQLR